MNSNGSRAEGFFGSLSETNAGLLADDSMSRNSASLDLKTEFQQWHRANRMLGRHWVVAERLGSRAMRAARWERGMVMLRGIHIEIAHRKVNGL